MLFPRHRPDEAAQDAVDAILRFCGWKLLDGRLGTDDEFELRKDVHDHPAVLPEGGEQPGFPLTELFVRPCEDLAHEVPECGEERTVRDVALELVELPRDEEPAALRERLVHLVQQCRFADARQPADEEALRRPFADAVERLKEEPGLFPAPVQPLVDREPVRIILRARRKGRELPAPPQLQRAPVPVGVQPSRRLITLLSGF